MNKNDMQNNFCTCKFKLGIVNFPNLVEAEDDPLCKLFEDYKWPYQDPITKQRKNMSLFDVINSQTHQEDDQERAHKKIISIWLEGLSDDTFTILEGMMAL